MLPHSLTNFEIQKCYQNKPKFKGIYSSNNLPKIRDGAWVINLDEYESIGTYWIALYVNGSHFNAFEVRYIPKEIAKLIGNKHITTNTYRIQANDSIMCGTFVLDLLILC